MENLSRVAAVIVTYNNKNMLRDLLEDLKTQIRSPDEIIVVDNGSVDDTDKMAKEFTQVRYIKLPENAGSAGGYYKGIKAALENNDFVWTLDDDVSVPTDSLKELLEGFKRLQAKENIALVRSMNKKYSFSSRSVKMNNFTWSGTLIKTEVFQKVGLINPDFFIYGEDLDFSFRLSKSGYKFFWIPASICYERRNYNKTRYKFFAKTITVYSQPFRFYYAFRNHSYILLRHRYFFKVIQTLLYGVKISALILAKEGLSGVVKIKAIIQGIRHGFMGKLGKSYDGNQ